MKNIKADFPIFTNNPEMIYLDSASTLQKPQVVIDAVSEYLSHTNANIHRGNYQLSMKSEELYEQSRSTVAGFVGASDESEVIFSANSTDSVNLLVRSLYRSGHFAKGDNIILTELEHHANLLPRQMIAEHVGMELRWIPVPVDGSLDVDLVKSKVDEKTKIIALSACSNVTGRLWLEEVEDVSRWLDGAGREVGSGNPSAFGTSPGKGRENSPLAPLREGGTRGAPFLVVDASQAVVHAEVDVKELGCDFLFFTGHKLGALTGIGVLRGKKALLKNMKPGKLGGGAVEQVTTNGSTFLGSPDGFEPGTPNVVGAISLAKGIEYIKKERKVGTQFLASSGNNGNTGDHHSLIQYCLDEFRVLEDAGKITLLGGYDATKKIGVFSFVPHEIGVQIIDQAMHDAHIALRVGAHCTHVFHAGIAEGLSCAVEKTVRISFWEYNELGELERFFEVLRNLLE